MLRLADAWTWDFWLADDDRTGRWTLLAYRNHEPDGRFIGELTDPMPIGWATDGSALKLDAVAAMTDATRGRPDHAGGTP